MGFRHNPRQGDQEDEEAEEGQVGRMSASFGRLALLRACGDPLLRKLWPDGRINLRAALPLRTRVLDRTLLSCPLVPCGVAYAHIASSTIGHRHAHTSPHV